MGPERHAITARIEVIAGQVFDKKLEDLDECEMREVWDLEAILRLDGRADPQRHARLASQLAGWRRSS